MAEKFISPGCKGRASPTREQMRRHRIRTECVHYDHLQSAAVPKNSRAALIKSARANDGTTAAACSAERLTPPPCSISVFMGASREIGCCERDLLSVRAGESIITFSLS